MSSQNRSRTQYALQNGVWLCRWPNLFNCSLVIPYLILIWHLQILLWKIFSWHTYDLIINQNSPNKDVPTGHHFIGRNKFLVAGSPDFSLQCSGAVTRLHHYNGAPGIQQLSTFSRPGNNNQDNGIQRPWIFLIVQIPSITTSEWQ